MKNNEIDLFKTRKDKKYLELIKDLIKEIKNNNGN